MDEHLICVETAVRLHERRLVSLAYSILRSLEQAKDEVQNAFIQLAKRDCPSIENKEAWLVTVCRNAAFKALSRGRRTTAFTESQWESLPDEATEMGGEMLEKKERAKLLLENLESLPEKQREVMRLYYLAGMKPAQIAEVLGEKPNNVHQLHFAGLSSLRKKMSVEPKQP